jgi:hypothetical protein
LFYVLLGFGNEMAIGVYLGSWELNIVRTLTALLLHLQLAPKVTNALNMIQYTLNNAESFAGQTIFFPVFVSFLLLLVSWIIEIGFIFLIMHKTQEYEVVLKYVLVAVIAFFESNITNFLVNLGVVWPYDRSIKDVPLQYVARSNFGACWALDMYFRKWNNGEIDSTMFEAALVTICCGLLALLSLVYETIYYYGIAVIPIFIVHYKFLKDIREHGIKF